VLSPKPLHLVQTVQSSMKMSQSSQTATFPLNLVQTSGSCVFAVLSAYANHCEGKVRVETFLIGTSCRSLSHGERR
jgi:hypothetical protein